MYNTHVHHIYTYDIHGIYMYRCKVCMYPCYVCVKMYMSCTLLCNMLQGLYRSHVVILYRLYIMYRLLVFPRECVPHTNCVSTYHIYCVQLMYMYTHRNMYMHVHACTVALGHVNHVAMYVQPHNMVCEACITCKVTNTCMYTF